MNKRARIFQNQTAMVRALFSLKGSSRDRNSIEVLKVEVFPLGFTFCVDSKDHFFEKIEDELRKAPERLFMEVAEIEPGLYEMVTEYRGRIEVCENNKYLECTWKVFQPHVYQLTDEDMEFLKVS